MSRFEGALCLQYPPEQWTEARHVSKKTQDTARICLECPAIHDCGKDAESQRLLDSASRDDRWTTGRPSGIWAARLYDGTRHPPRSLIGSHVVS